MIGIVFTRGGDEVVEVRINGNSVSWRSTTYGAAFFPIDALSLSKDKVMKEFPELEDAADWKEIAMRRLKDKLNSYSNENEKANYIVGELSKIGYTPHSYQKQGERIKKWDS